MPLVVSCEELQPGMRLAEPFIWRERVLVTADTVLTVADINSLKARFPKETFRVADPILEAAVDFEDDSYEREVARTVQTRIAECMSKVQTKFSPHASLNASTVSTIHTAVLEVIRYLEDHPVSAALIDNFMGGKGYLSERSGNVFYLSMVLGTASHEYVSEERRRQSTARDLEPRTVRNLVPLGLGSMLIDLGMMPLQHLFDDPDSLTPEAWQEIRAHPSAGAEMLPDDTHPATKMIVRTHHENMDGSGYPAELPGEKIHVFSRIVRIADAYDAATSTRAYRQAKSSARVLWEMSVGPYRRFYDPILMRAFVRLIQPFAIGAKIRLRNGQYAVVVKYNRENPFAPVVIVAFDQHDRRIPDHELSDPVLLGEYPGLRAASFAGEDLRFLYDGDTERIGRSRIGKWPTLFEAAYP